MSASNLLTTCHSCLRCAGRRYPFLTLKERDVETGLDYFEARHYASAQGRFTSADPGKFVPADPQNWNRYSYTQSNPLKYVDLTGRDLYLTGDYAEELAGQLEGKSGYKLNYDKTTGKVTIDASQKRQTKGTSKTLASAIHAAATSEKDVSIGTVSESKDKVEILGDRFITRQLDIDDYRVFNRDAPALATGFLTHILTEYTVAANIRVPYTNEVIFAVSHHLAMIEETKSWSDVTHTETVPRSDNVTSGGINAPPMTVREKYYSVQYDIVFKSGANGRATQIDRVITVKQHSKKGSKP